MKIINNITEKLSDELKQDLRAGSRLSIAAACFSVYAFEELKTQLLQIDALRFIFTSPTFLAEQPKQEQREFYIPRRNREKALHGSEFEIRLRNAFTQRAISKECADWIRQKAVFKSNISKEKSPHRISCGRSISLGNWKPMRSSRCLCRSQTAQHGVGISRGIWTLIQLSTTEASCIWT